ncbi:MAG: pyrimidine dimer DNA glycosylase/endonuclease V [archaeon]
MNIFILDEDPVKAAEMQCDKHVVKMPLETAQMLSTAHHVLGTDVDKEKIYRKTHVNHPCTKWVRENSANYEWTVEHFKALLKEFKKRYGKKHACSELLPKLSKLPNFPEDKLIDERTQFAQAVPEEYKKEDPVEAYREVYMKEKSKFACWDKLGNKPSWYTDKYNND